MLAFINRLFEHPAFDSPNLSSEVRRAKSDITEFSLAVTYLPASAETAVTGEATTAAGNGPAGAGGGEDAEPPEAAGEGAREEAEE